MRLLGRLATYALAAYTAEGRQNGWYMARTATFVGEKLRWTSPFVAIEKACLPIALHLATEITDRKPQG
jgi:hypothetical protein